MKAQVILPLTIVVSVALVGLMRIRKKEHDKEDKRSRFEDIKLRVTFDVLGEYQNEYTEKQTLLEKTQSEHKQLEEEMNMVKIKGDKAKGEADICKGDQKTVRDEMAKVELEVNNLRAENEKEQMNWKKELTMLQQQLAERSPLCNLLKTGSEAASKVCSKEVVKEAPKPEEPKAEAPKAEAPKPEAPKAEAPKPEEPKAEAPKPEEPKAEAPKPEEPKAEAPKAEAPKPEAPKAEAPKPEAPKAEAPKPEAPKAEAPKPEAPKAEAPKPEEPKAEAPKNS